MNGAKCFAPPNTVNVHGNQNRFAARRRPHRRRRKNRFQSFAGHQLLPSSQRHGAIAAPRDLSAAAQHLPPGLRPGRLDRLHLHLHRIAPAAARRALQRPPPQTVFPGHRHGHHAGGPADLVARPQLRHRARRGGAGGHGLLRVSSRIFSRGAHGFRWTARHGAVAVSSRRQRRLRAGPVARGVCVPRGQASIAWFSFVALLGIILLADIGAWAKRRRATERDLRAAPLTGHVIGSAIHPHVELPRKKVLWSLAVLVTLIFSKFFYLSSLGSYYTFYLMDKFHVSIQSAQIHLFIFLGAVAAGTFFGGPVGDRMGRKFVIWYSILGVLPFTLLLPYANLFWTSILSVVIGLILASAFSTILVFAQELVPGKVGTISGLYFGLAFGLGGVGAALLGKLADATSIGFVYHVCSFLPAVGILTVFLPDIEPARRKS